MTIHQIKYTGRNHSSCGYAGITVYNINENGTFHKIPTMCYINNYQDYEYRNIYTQYPSMLLVLYSYKKYSNISLNVSLSTSYCKPKPIHICELEPEPLSLESTIMFSIKGQSCIVLQLDYIQGNLTLSKRNNIYKFRSYIEIADGAYLKRGK